MTHASPPSTWAAAEIGQICSLINGKAFKPSDWMDVGLPIIRIQNLNNPSASFNHFDGPVADKFLVQNGELLFAWSGTPGTSFGAHIWSGETAVLNQHIFRVLFNDGLIDKRFLRLAINQKLEELIGKAHGGVGLRHVTKGKFEATEIALPPTEEQRRIVAKIEALMARSGRAKEALDAIPALLDRYRQSVLAAAFRGDLTADWRTEHPDIEPAYERWSANCATNKIELFSGLPESWACFHLAALCHRVSVGHVGPTSQHYCDPDAGVIFVRSQNVRPARLNLLEVRYIDPGFHKSLRKSQLQGGDILIVRVGANRGDTCMVPYGLGEMNCANVVFARPLAGISEYLEAFLQSPIGQSQLLGFSTGSAQGVINTKSAAKLIVPIPPEPEQQEIMERLRSSEASYSLVRQRVAQAKKEAAQLDSAVLAKAFRGELVPQDPNDEPASELLARIKAERAATGTPTRRGRRRKQGQPSLVR